MRMLLPVALASTLLTQASFAQTAHILDNPDSVSVYLLQEIHSNSAPDFVALAGNDPSVKAADEFHKQALQDQIATQLRAKFAALQGVDTIVVNLYSTFGPYDSDYGEYDFDINSGSFIDYTALGQQVEIALTNGNDAQSWPLKPDAAAKVLDLSNQQRNVTLVLTLALENSPPPLYGQPGVLNTKVISYDVLAGQTTNKLGHVVVQSSP
jgi:hypothetical protein